MSEKPTENKTVDDKSKAQDIHVDVKVDQTETKRIAEELAAEKAAKKELEDKLAKAETDRKAKEEESKKLIEEAEDLKNKMGIIAEKELDKKRKAVTEKANALLQDPTRVKEITDKLSTPEGVEQMEYTMNVLEKQMKKGEEEFKAFQAEQQKKLDEAAAKAKADKEAADKAIAEAIAKGEKPPVTPPKPATTETATGTAPLNDAQMGSGKLDMKHMKFESYGAMIRYLQDIEKGSDKLQAAQATVALNDLLTKWATLVRENHSRSPQNIVPEKLDPNTQPSFKQMGLSKAAKEELKRRQQGETPRSVIAGGEA